MKESVLVIGSGGREHALGWRLKQSPQVGKLYFAPGNGGTEEIGQNVEIGVNNIEELIRFASENRIEFVVVGPEAPLGKGIVNEFLKEGVEIFGPSKEAAQLETNKVWAIRFMQRHGIPHPRSRIFKETEEALAFVKNPPWPQIVIKASGLAAGKGVILPDSVTEAEQALFRIMVKKEFDEGKEVIIQERLLGKEVSLQALTDGKTIVPLLPAQDHKRVFDHDRGSNTGGMGAFVPTPTMNEKLLGTVCKEVLEPTIAGMNKEGFPYKGVLYAGLMIANNCPKVLEFNCRFGDPETQPLMTLFSSDIFLALKACAEGDLGRVKIEFRQGSALCVVLASKGYPGVYEKEKVIHGLEEISDPNIQVFHAGTKKMNGLIITNGGRVLGVTAYAKTIEDARKKVYSMIGDEGIHFEGMHCREDIGY